MIHKGRLRALPRRNEIEQMITIALNEADAIDTATALSMRAAALQKAAANEVKYGSSEQARFLMTRAQKFCDLANIVAGRYIAQRGVE